MLNSNVPLVIPAYEPDDALIALCVDLINQDVTNIVIIDDGSGKEYEQIFNELRNLNIEILVHFVNLGKGRALKDAFNYLLINTPGLLGCVTADSDGQHKPVDIIRCIEELYTTPNNLILGCRTFDNENVPWKSAIGNKLTRKICRYLCGINVSDTQTGLRGIPCEFMKELLNVPGERFEFETNMLIASKDRTNIIEIDIQTVYDSKEEHKTHFEPIRDSLQIYKIFGSIFLKYLISSLSSCLIDLLIFSFCCGILRNNDSNTYIFISTVIARIISATYNYGINYKIVFESREKVCSSAPRYFLLAIIQMALSAFLVCIIAKVFIGLPEVTIKAVVDIVLFFISYKVQQLLVF